MLTEFATLVQGLDPQPLGDYFSDENRSSWSRPPIAYERIFEMLQALCGLLYPSVTSTSASWDNWAPGTTASEAKFDSYSIMPLSARVSPGNVFRLLSKTALYSDIAVITIDATLENGYISYSYTGGDRKLWTGSWPVLVNQIITHRELLARGRCAFLPTISRRYEASISQEEAGAHQAPLVQRPPDVRLTPVNPTVAVSLSDALVYEKIILPYFPGTDLSKIADIADKETDAFIIFNSYMKKRLADIAGCASTAAVEEIVDEMRAGAASLAITARKIAQGRLLRGTEVGLFAISLGAIVATHGAAFPSELAGVTGSVTLLDLLKEFTASRKEKIDLRQSEFFIPYLLRQ